MAIFNTVYGGEWKWKPWSNTIAYYPLTTITTTSDMKGSGTAYDLTNWWDVTFWTYNWVNCAHFGGTATSSRLYSSTSLFTWSSTFTVNLWYRATDTMNWHNNIFSVWTANWTNSFVIWINNPNSQWTLYVWWWNNDRNAWYLMEQDKWYNITYTHDNWTIKVYVNWNLEYTWSVSFTIQNWFTWLWTSVYSRDGMIWNLSEVIVESAEWTSDEVAKYYNSTKANYS